MRCNIRSDGSSKGACSRKGRDGTGVRNLRDHGQLPFHAGMNRRSAGSVLASRTCIRSLLETAARTLQDGPIRLAPHPQFRTCPFLTSNQHVCSNPWAVSRVWCRGYVQGSDEHVRSSRVPISPLPLSMFVYCRRPHLQPRAAATNFSVLLHTHQKSWFVYAWEHMWQT